MNKKSRYSLFALVIIVVLAFLLRIWQVSSLPPILNREEAALAYNAVLLKESGKDEWEKVWPLSLQSFGDYKLPGYPVVLVGFFSVFGVSDLVVRLPSVLAGTALILIGYAFARRMLGLKQWQSVLAAAVIAVQPVFFFFSRMAWEANLGLSLFLTGILLLLVGASTSTTKKRLSYVNDVVGLVLILAASFVYNTPFLLSPFIIPLVIIWRKLRSPQLWVVPVLGLMLILIVGTASFVSVSKQKSGITIFTDESTWMESTQYRQQWQGVAQTVLGNRYVFFGQKIVQSYLASVGPRFLAQAGGTHPWQSIPGHGHLLPVIYVFGWVGILWAVVEVAASIVSKSWSRAKVPGTMIFLLVVSLLSAVITVDAPHATRSLLFFFIWSLIAVQGLWWTLEVLQRDLSLKKYAKASLVIGLFMALLTIQGTWYFSSYFQQFPQHSASVLQAGFSDALVQAEVVAGERKIAIVDHSGYQYILAAWYGRMSSEQFFSTIERHLPDTIGFRYGYKVGRYRFIADRQDRFEDESVIVEWNPEKNTWEVDVL